MKNKIELIDKAAVVAEIEKMRDKAYPQSDWNRGYVKACEKLLSFINSLEVKDVDLEKEFDNYTKDILARDVQFEPFTHLYNCAKHFFELGLKAKGE